MEEPDGSWSILPFYTSSIFGSRIESLRVCLILTRGVPKANIYGRHTEGEVVVLLGT